MSKHRRRNLRSDNRLFKQIMGDMDAVKDFLRFWLPAELKDLCDFETIRSEPTSFKDINRNLECDMLHSIRAKNAKYDDDRLYVIVDHQHRPYKGMKYRMKDYEISVRKRGLSQSGHDPYVFSIMLYHGKRTPYPYGANFVREKESAFYKHFDRKSPGTAFKFKLADITTMADQDLMTHGRVAAMEMALKYTRKKYTDIGQPVQFLCNMQELKNSYGDKYEHLFNPCLWYWYDQSGVFKKFGMDELSQAVPENVREGIMAKLQSWTREIRQEGFQEGLQKSKLKVAQNMLNAGMSYQEVMKFTGIEPDELAALEKNAARNDASFAYQGDPAPVLKDQPSVKNDNKPEL